MNKPDPKQLVEKIIPKIEFELKADEKHLLAQAIDQYFQVQQSIDDEPRTGAMLKSLKALEKASQDICESIDNLGIHGRRILNFYISKHHDNRDVSKELEQARNSAEWLSQKVERVIKKISPILLKDKGGQRKQIARLIFVHHLILIYEMANPNKKAGSSSPYKDKNGKWRIGKFGRFATACLGVLEPAPGPSAIAKIIKEAKKISQP